jgi:hypothetical protein
MRTYAKTPSGPDPASPRGMKGRHAKPSGPPVQNSGDGRPLTVASAQDPPAPAGGPLAQQASAGPDWREPALALAASRLPRRVAGQSGRIAGQPGRVAIIAGDPLHLLGVIEPLKVSGAPPWEPAPKPPDIS